MAKKYIVPHILTIDADVEKLILLSYSIKDNVRSYGITGGGFANSGQDTESKKRNTLFDLDNDPEW